MKREKNGNKREKTDAANILRPSDGYKNLKVYKLATLIHDVTVRFVELYIPARTCFVLKEKVILAGEPDCVTEA